MTRCDATRCELQSVNNCAEPNVNNDNHEVRRCVEINVCFDVTMHSALNAGNTTRSSMKHSGASAVFGGWRDSSSYSTALASASTNLSWGMAMAAPSMDGPWATTLRPDTSGSAIPLKSPPAVPATALYAVAVMPGQRIQPKRISGELGDGNDFELAGADKRDVIGDDQGMVRPLQAAETALRAASIMEDRLFVLHDFVWRHADTYNLIGLGMGGQGALGLNVDSDRTNLVIRG